MGLNKGMKFHIELFAVESLEHIIVVQKLTCPENTHHLRED
jgi:hypothetical protein